jgi:hypothetical protein
MQLNYYVVCCLITNDASSADLFLIYRCYRYRDPFRPSFCELWLALSWCPAIFFSGRQISRGFWSHILTAYMYDICGNAC